MRFRSIAVGTTSVLLVVSMTTNLLMLTGPLFMLQVYDRVLTSKSLPTLAVLVLLVVGLYSFYGLLDILRTRIASRLARAFDELLGERLFRLSISLRVSAAAPDQVDPVRDGDIVRSFLAGPGPLALLDLPWIPVYLGILFIVHPLLGWLSTAGGLVATSLMVASEVALRRSTARLASTSARRHRMLEEAKSGAELILAMGLSAALGTRWKAVSEDLLERQTSAGDIGTAFSSTIKATRLLLQSLVLALGAYLVISGEMTGGLMMAASVLTSRALAPVEQTVSQWKAILSARAASRRLQKLLSVPERSRLTNLPAPRHKISVRAATVAAPGNVRPILLRANFELEAGDGLGILGPSGAGKTSLAKALLGVWPVASGEIRFDGALLEHYESRLLPGLIGYLPQRIDLFDGTVAENIARLTDSLDSNAVVAAAQLADIHDLISSLPDGYDTQVGAQGERLSAGQRQRIGLARALYGNPFLCVLDEPNANLDADGELALTSAIRRVRDRGGIAVVIAHRPSAIAAVDKLLFLKGSRQVAFGQKDEVLAQIRGENVRELKAATP